MTDSQMQITEQPIPSSDQLEKIVHSLSLLIEMQSDRDEQQTSAFERIMNRLESLQAAVNQLASSASPEQTSSESEVDNLLVKSICAKYGLDTNDDTTPQGELVCDSNNVNRETESLDNDSVASEEESSEGEEEEVVVEASDEPLVFEIPPMDLEEINAIKQQLYDQLRKAEIELSMRRANLSQREALIEEKEARLQQELQHKTILSPEFDDSPGGNTMLSRLKLHLREFTAAKMGKYSQNRDLNSSGDEKAPSQIDPAITCGDSIEPSRDDEQP